MLNPYDFMAAYRETGTRYPNHRSRPLVGITTNTDADTAKLAKGYYLSIEAAGGIPVLIPPTDNRALLLALLERLDGILLSGGGDINPLYAGEEPSPALHGINAERDSAELLLARLAYDRHIPLLGICRGMQVLTLALGGRIHQDLREAMPEAALVKHAQEAPRETMTHSVYSVEGSVMEQLFGDKFYVNSFHHQGVADPGPLLRVSARAGDGVVEAVESTALHSALGVQWHPECFHADAARPMAALFRHFVEDCELLRRARKVHSEVLTLDSHCDTALRFAAGADLTQRADDTLLDLHRMDEGMLDAAVLAAYIPQGERTDEALAEATLRTDNILGMIKHQVLSNPSSNLIYTPKALFQARAAGKRAFLLGIENGYALGRDLSNIERYRREGVTYITLCHNGDNDICDSACKSQHEHGGLSDFGRQVVQEMNRVGLIIDLSHASEETFYDVLNLSTVPVICSHSSARALCDHPRNLTDEQLRALAAADGVAQATFYSGFLRSEGEADVRDVVRHVMHMIDVAGIDHVGFGSDFDGDGGVLGLASAADMLNLTCCLMAEGLQGKHLRKLWSGNFVRVMSRVQHEGYIKF